MTYRIQLTNILYSSLLLLACMLPGAAQATNATDTQPFVCKDNSGNVVADSNCNGAKPADNTRVGANCTAPGSCEPITLPYVYLNAMASCGAYPIPALSDGQTYAGSTSEANPSASRREFEVRCNNGVVTIVLNQCINECFLPDTLITLADGSHKEVRELKVGDRLQGQTRINTVIAVPNFDKNGAVYGFNGSKPFVTAGHPFMTQEGWKAIDPSQTAQEGHRVIVGPLKAGDILSMEDYTTMKITSIDRHDDGSHHVYNPRLDGDHTYYANGKLVHNK